MHSRFGRLVKFIGVSVVPTAACWALISASGSPAYLEAPPGGNKSEAPKVSRRETSPSPEDDYGAAEWTPEGGGQRIHAPRTRPKVRVSADNLPGGGSRAFERHSTVKLMPRTGSQQPPHGDGIAVSPSETEAMRMERRKTTRQMPRRATAKPPPPPPPVETEYRGSACDRYNNLFHRINWKGRRVACNGCDGCIFVGRSVTGSCIERENMDQDYADPDAEDYDDEEYYEDADEEGTFDDHEVNMVETKLLATLVATVRQEGIEQPVRVLVTGSLAEAMTDSLRTGQSVTEQLAKELLVDALEDPEAALAIKHILANDSLRASTRGLIYWLVREPWTVEETNKLLTWQLDYLLKDNKWTVQTLAKTAEWLLGTEETEKAVKGLLKWCFDRDADGPSYRPTVELVESLAPGVEELAAWGLQQSVHWALDDEYVKQLAKDSVKDLLLQRLSLFEKEKEAAAEQAASAQKPVVKEGEDGKREDEEEEEAGPQALDDEISPPTSVGEEEDEDREQQAVSSHDGAKAEAGKGAGEGQAEEVGESGGMVVNPQAGDER